MRPNEGHKAFRYRPLQVIGPLRSGASQESAVHLAKYPRRELYQGQAAPGRVITAAGSPLDAVNPRFS